VQPTVSVIIPAYNAAEFIGAAIESVLSQEVHADEILVIDDGSSDNTASVVRAYGDPVRYIGQPNGGPARARNRGLAEARGDYIAFLDADDLWLADKLRRQVAFLERHPEVGFCFSDCVEFDARGEEARSFLQSKTVFPKLPVDLTDSGGTIIVGKLYEQLLFENFIVTSTVVIRGGVWPREHWFHKTVYFDEGLYNGQDFDLWFRLATQMQGGFVAGVLARKRCHHANISTRSHTALINRIKLRTKIAHLAEKREDISSKAKNRCRDRLLYAYADLGRWSLLHGDKEGTRKACADGLKVGIRADLLLMWLVSRMGERVPRWLVRVYRFGRASGT
jgi:glycosyltransferase involved in cell wall biosynthesis